MKALTHDIDSRNEAPQGSALVTVRIAPGELIDRITILEIKTEQITDPQQLANVERELTALRAARQQELTVPPMMAGELARLEADLKRINGKLWRIEDKIRDCERMDDFGPAFIALARSVYQSNDVRAAVKRQINELLGSAFTEEKSYAAY
jgi:predicted  nucleic acid-binding Zn-ribbon protein